MAIDDINKLLLQGKELMDKGEYKKAIKKFDAVLKADPDNADGYFGKAEASVGVPKISLVDVAQLYRLAIKNDPENSYFYSVYGDFCLSNGLLPQAEENYKKAIELDSEGAVFHYLDLAIGYYNNGLLFLDRQLNLERDDIVKKSVEYVFAAFDLDPKSGSKLVESLTQSKDQESELELLLKSPEYDNEAGKLEKLDRASEYKSFIEKEPSNPYNYLSFGQYCFENGLLTLGKEQYLRAIDLDPFESNQSLYYNELAAYNYRSGLEIHKDKKSQEFLDKVTFPSLKYSLKAMGLAPQTVMAILYK
jgi:tetratricopeptide (TPR) repeat protein